MTSRRILASITLAAVAITVVACSDSQSSTASSTTTSSSPVETSTATTEVAVSTTSTTSSTTSTSTTSTTTTIPAVQGLEMSASGLGDALFGTDADSVVDYVDGILGAPTSDSGWVDPNSTGAACPGTQVRFVAWNDLSLFFSDQSPAASGFRHFAQYVYGPAFTTTMNPNGLMTAEGVGIGTTVKTLKATYPSAVVTPGNNVVGTSFSIESGLMGFLTGPSDADGILAVVGGFGCANGGE